MFNDIFQGRRVLVTGHTGFKGSWLVQWLLDLGAQVAGFSLPELPSEPSHFTLLNVKDKIRHFEGDIRDRQLLKSAFETFQPDVVFHLAAQPIVSTSISDPVTTFETNVMGTINVLECIRQMSSFSAAVFITSDKCYENVEWEFGYRETDAVGGKDPYSASKGCAELAFHSYYRTYFAGSAAPLATGRAGNVIGGGDWAKDRIVPDCIRAWSQNKSPLIRSPHATRPWQHVLEPLSGYLALAQSLIEKKADVSGASFNFGPAPDTTATVGELLDECKRSWTGKDWVLDGVKQPLNGKEAGLLRLNCDRAQQRLKWKAVLNFEETAKASVDWYRSFYEEKQILTSKQIERYCSLAQQRGLAWVR